MAAQEAIPNTGRIIREYPLAGGATFKIGAAVVVAAGVANECGADPASILGFALHDAGAIPNSTTVLVALCKARATFLMSGTSNPVATDVGVAYGLAKDGNGVWIVDKTDVVNTRIVVEKVDLTRNLFEVTVLAANRQVP